MNMPSDAPRRFQIVVRGECASVLRGVFPATPVGSRGGYTYLIATVRDQPELYGLLDRLAELALWPVGLVEVGAEAALLMAAAAVTRAG